MQLKEYIDKNLPNLNWNILPQIFEDEDIELTEEIKAYLKETPGNTNWNIFKDLTNKNEEESWPKLIHVIYDNDWKMANDSDFSTFTEAYNFIKSNWETTSYISSEYIILKHINTIIESDCHVGNNSVEWYKNGMIYLLNENSYGSYDDN